MSADVNLSGPVPYTSSVCLEALVVHPFSLELMNLSRLIMVVYLMWRSRGTLMDMHLANVCIRHVPSGFVKWDVSVALWTLNQYR